MLGGMKFFNDPPPENEETRLCRLESPLGMITLTGSLRGLGALLFEGQKYFTEHCAGAVEGPLPVFEETRAWLEGYFSGKKDLPLPALAPRGTKFYRAVWEILLSIPWGQNLSYAGIAERLGSSPRAVGGAVGRNPISIIIPCHRVLGKGGALTGYAGGLERKRRLLELEGGTFRLH